MTIFQGFDNRYPWLVRINRAEDLSYADIRYAERVAKRLMDNTGLSTCYNTRTGDLFCYYRSPHGGPFSIPYYDKETKSCRRYTDEEVGDYIRLAKYGQLEAAEKEEIAAKNKKELEYRSEQKTMQTIQDREPEMKDMMDFRSRERRGTQKVIAT